MQSIAFSDEVGRVLNNSDSIMNGTIFNSLNPGNSTGSAFEGLPQRDFENGGVRLIGCKLHI